MARPTRWLRAGLVFYLGVELLVGGWATLCPRGFYDHFPLARAPLGGSAAGALVAYLVFAVPHLVFHLDHLEPFGTVDAVAQPAALVALALLPVLLLALVQESRSRRP
jgi:hypothetical protein